MRGTTQPAETEISQARAAAAELDRISGRRAAPAGGLTPGERRVAELAADGL